MIAAHAEPLPPTAGVGDGVKGVAAGIRSLACRPYVLIEKREKSDEAFHLGASI